MNPRPLAPEEDGAAAALFARAFVEDPFAVLVGPRHAGLRHWLLERQYRAEIAALRSAEAFVSCVPVDGDGGGAELRGVLTADRHPPQRRPWPSRTELTMAAGGPLVLRRAMASERALTRSRPREPHLYVIKVAVAAEHRGTGVGRALLDHVLDHADREQLPTLLDTMRAETAAYYERFGFQTTRRLGLSPDLHAWLMTRRAPARPG